MHYFVTLFLHYLVFIVQFPFLFSKSRLEYCVANGGELEGNGAAGIGERNFHPRKKLSSWWKISYKRWRSRANEAQVLTLEIVTKIVLLNVLVQIVKNRFQYIFVNL